MEQAGNSKRVSGLGQASDWFILVQTSDMDEALLELQDRYCRASMKLVI
jgi:hypothetical protein